MLANDPSAKYAEDDLPTRNYYTTELTLGQYIERAQDDAERARMKEAGERWKAQEDARTARDQRLQSLISQDRCVNYENETIMNTTLRECKIETTDKVEFIEGKAPKFDSGKIRLDLLPVRPMKDVAEVLTIGADKYGANSWREGEMIAWSRCYAAAQRHLMQFWSGEDLDQETGKSHLAHAACNLLFMIEHSYINKQGDDRPTTGAPFKDNQ
jgi:hypothetical protein